MKRVITGVALATLAACGKQEAAPDTTAMATPATPAVAAPTMFASIVSPADGDSVTGPVTIVLSSRGVTIEKAAGTKVEGVGHYHLFVDTATTADGVLIPPTTDKVIHIGTGDSTYTFKTLAPGPHEVIVVVGYGDHTTMNTARDTVRFVVRK